LLFLTAKLCLGFRSGNVSSMGEQLRNNNKTDNG